VLYYQDEHFLENVIKKLFELSVRQTRLFLLETFQIFPRRSFHKPFHFINLN